MSDLKAPPIEAALSERILTHMNRDHKDSLTRYLQAHTRCSSFFARHARMTSLTTTHLQISSSSLLGTTTATIPVSPAMNALGEARERLVAMDKAAMEKLGKSPYTVKKYQGPEGAVWLWIAFLSVVWVFEARLEHARIVGDWLGSEQIKSFLLWQQPKVLGTMLFLHLLEALYQTRRCERHSIPAGSSLWWKWVRAVAFEGFTAFNRFGRVVEEEKERQERTIH